jgi:dUTP pyrophosphatase
MIQVKILLLSPDVVIPEKQTKTAAGFDVRAYLPKGDLVVSKGKGTLVPTGFSLEIPEDYHVEIRPRSGLSSKHHVLIPNSPGTIDSDYRGEIFVPLLNLGQEDFTITNGMRIAQMLLRKTWEMEFQVVNFLTQADRGKGGFGSTGLH